MASTAFSLEVAKKSLHDEGFFDFNDSTVGEHISEMERKAFLKLEQWLIAIVGKRLNLEEQYIGTALIMDLRRAMGLPLVAGARERDFDREAELLGPSAQSPSNVLPITRKR